MSDPGPLARLEAVKADPLAPSVIAQRLADGEDLREIAKAWGVPRGRFIEWFTETYPEKFDAACKALGISLVHAVQKMVDEATPETVALVKMQTDRYLRVAALLNPERYSPKVEHKHSGLQPSLTIILPPAEPPVRVIEQEPQPGLPEPETLI